MAGLLVLMLVLLLVSTNARDLFQQCCPEDEQHLFLKKDKVCKTSRFSILLCEEQNKVNLLPQNNSYYWFIEGGNSLVITSESLNVVLTYNRFCVATIVDESLTEDNTTVWQEEEGILYCDGAQPYTTYMGPDPLMFAACILISGIGCFLTFIVYILVSELRKDVLNKCLVNALFCYSLLYLIQGVTTFRTYQLPHSFCSYQSLLTFFWITASIFWTYVISFDIWRCVVYQHFPSNESHLLMVYYFWGWAMPVLLCFAGVQTDDSRAIRIVDSCRINPVYVFASYAQPALVLFFLALLYFVWSVCKLWNQDSAKSPDDEAADLTTVRHKCYLHWKLFLVISIPWMICIMATYAPGNSFTRIVMYTLAAVQGPLLFLLLVILRKKVLLGIAEKLVNCGLHCPVVIMSFATNLNDEDNNSDEADQLIVKVQDVAK